MNPYNFLIFGLTKYAPFGKKIAFSFVRLLGSGTWSKHNPVPL
jgi:hypothetical protein